MARPGAVIDVEFGRQSPDLAIAAWEAAARWLLDDMGWKDEVTCVRRFEGGASLAISAPVDVLYTATEINDAAWDAALDLLEGGNRHLLRRVGQQLRTEIRDEERPRLRRLLRAARERGKPVVLDTEAVSIGLGRHSRCWDLAEVPHPDDVDWRALESIPLALVTGTNGKTTTVRMMSAIGAAAGLVTGVSSTDWLAIGGEVIERDDYAGPEGARRVLRSPECELAVLETARGGLLRRGLAVERADAALITNIASDHMGEFGVQTLDELADVKWVVTRALGADGQLVLNADDPLLVARAPTAPCPIVWFSADADHPLLADHAARGGRFCTVQDERIVLGEGDAVTEVVKVRRIPLCFDGKAAHNVANALGAAALAWSLGLPAKAIKRGLKAMAPDDNPGRGNLYCIDGVNVMLDFAHNPHGMRAMAAMAAGMQADCTVLIIGQAGDRSDDDIRDFARASDGLAFDRVLIKRMQKYNRGRGDGEVAALLRKTFLEMGYGADQLEDAETEVDALHAALRWAKPGDLVLCLAHEDRDGVRALLEARK